MTTSTKDLSGQVVLVTGAASGIGQRTADRVHVAGAAVVALDLSIATDGDDDRRMSLRLDVCDETGWAEVVAQTMARFGRIDGLVNCAGIIRLTDITDLALADFQKVMAVNVDGTFLGVKHVMKAMETTGDGSIVNISSTAGINGFRGAAAYCASKGAVRLLSKAAALEAIGKGNRIRVNSLHPAMTATPMVDTIVDQLGGGDETREALRLAHPSARLATTDEIADAILFLLSDGSRFMNGSELVVDNGLTAT